MGMDAKVKIWIGIQYAYVPLEEFGDGLVVPRGLPKAVRVALDAYSSSGYTMLREGEEWFEGMLGPGMRAAIDVVHGFEALGFGLTVYQHDWDYGVVPFDADALKAAVDEWLPAVRARFQEWGLTAPIGVWCATDYS